MEDGLSRHDRIGIEHDHEVVIVTTTVAKLSYVARLATLVSLATAVVHRHFRVATLKLDPHDLFMPCDHLVLRIAEEMEVDRRPTRRDTP